MFTSSCSSPVPRRGLLPILILLLSLVLCGCARQEAIPEATASPAPTAVPEVRFLDARDRALTRADYLALREQYPEAEIRWMVPLSGGGADSFTEELILSSLTEADLPLLDFFPALRRVETGPEVDPALALAVRQRLPEADCRWWVTVAGTAWPSDTEELTVPDGFDPVELSERLGYLPGLKSVSFAGERVDKAVIDSLCAVYPDLVFRWNVELLGRIFPNMAFRISFAGRRLTAEELTELRENLFRFPALEAVDLTGCGLDGETLHQLDLDLGPVDVVWTFSLYGVQVCSTDREIDLSYKVNDRGWHLEQALPWFSHLEKVIICGCMGNQTMDALNKKYENIRFVWEVYFGGFSLRTDATYFTASRTYNNASIYSDQLEVLQYCPDLIALDLGHRNLTHLRFLYYLPKLQYLILVENDINDITPIGALSELKYLELFWTKVEDLSPLVNCTALLDLNISYVYARPENAYETLMQMPWLERLWYCGNVMNEEQVEALRENMPGCEMYLVWGGEATGGGWRDHPHYFEMRDALDMYYMPGGTNGVRPDGSQSIVPG